MDARRRPVSLLVVVLTLACAAVAGAGDDHGRARAAYEAGEIVSLQAILDRYRRSSPDRRSKSSWRMTTAPGVYKVKLLTHAGAIVNLDYDARDGRLLRVKGRGAEAVRRQR